MERGKVRIVPLELFPNGLLLEKPTPTLVEPHLEVTVIGIWTDGMVVEGRPDHSRRVYENELVQREEDLPILEAAYDALPSSGTGRTSRGSWANKVKCCRSRIGVLKRGLGFVDASFMVHAEVAAPDIKWTAGSLVLVPSGRAALVTGFQPMGNTTYVKLRTRLNGIDVLSDMPPEVLRPWDQARLATI